MDCLYPAHWIFIISSMASHLKPSAIGCEESWRLALRQRMKGFDDRVASRAPVNFSFPTTRSNVRHEFSTCNFRLNSTTSVVTHNTDTANQSQLPNSVAFAICCSKAVFAYQSPSPSIFSGRVCLCGVETPSGIENCLGEPQSWVFLSDHQGLAWLFANACFDCFVM